MSAAEILSTLFDGLGVGLIAFILYTITFFIKKYNLENWVVKAVNAAEIMFDAPGSSKEKKQWVIDFLKGNGLTAGIPDGMVDALIEAAVNTLNIQQGQEST